jgi:uncharacterized membrane protein (UPF0127 family)
MRPPLLLLVLFSGCHTASSSGAQSDTSHTPLQNAGTTPAQQTAASAQAILSPPGRDPVSVAVEIAQTPEQRQQGLMYRKQLAPDAGMLFLFDRPQQQTFWMHNTLIPLDMIFITQDWVVLGVVENATPLTDSPRSVPGASQYVLEVNAGFARRIGLNAGNAVRYVPASQN